MDSTKLLVLLPLLAGSFSTLTVSAKAQVQRHTLTATVSSNFTAGFFGFATVGTPLVVVFDVDHSVSPLSSTAGTAVYGGLVLATSITAGPVTCGSPATASTLGMINDLVGSGGITCTDSRALTANASGIYQAVSLDAFDVGSDPAGFPVCPPLNASTAIPATLWSPVDYVQIPGLPIIHRITITSNGEVLMAEVNAESITSLTHNAEFCNGDGGDQMGCSDCPCSNNASPGTIGGCLNSAGTSARLSSSCALSVSLPPGIAFDLRFALQGAPPGAFCILNSGDALAPTNGANPCFGLGSGAQAASFDGLRCAVMNTRRHGGRSADVLGAVGLTNNPWGGEGGPPAGLAQAGSGFVSGQTRYFQVIHRDDPLASCMRGLNTSQAIEITFEP